MSRGLSQQQEQILARLRTRKCSLDVTGELLPELGLEPDDSTRRSLLRAVRLLERRGLVTLKRAPSNRGGHPRLLVADRYAAHTPHTPATKRPTLTIIALDKLQRALSSLDSGYLTDYGVEGADDTDLSELDDELLGLQRWLDDSLKVLGEHKGHARTRETLRKLESANTAGMTPAEVEARAAAARRKRRKQKLEEALTAQPKVTPAPKRKPSEARKRKRYLHAKRRAGDTSPLMNLRLRVLGVQELLEDIDLPAYGVEAADDEDVFDAYDELKAGAEWLDDARADLTRVMRRRGMREAITLSSGGGNT